MRRFRALAVASRRSGPGLPGVSWVRGSLFFRLRGLVMALAPHPLVEARRCATGDGDRGPVVARQDAGNEDDLPDVVAAVGQRALDRQRHGVRLAPDGHGLADV